MSKQKLIVIVGPTSSGKSALGVFLARKLGGEVVSADSRQVYKGLNIGTGKITKKEMQGVPHHLLDVAPPKKQFSVDDFVRLAKKAHSNILQNDRMTIVVGGTGLYVDMFTGRMSYPNVPPNKKLRERLEQRTTKQLFAQLKKLDPARARTIEPGHKRRLIRAIEIAKGLSFEETRRVREGGTEKLKPDAKYQILWLGLNPGQDVLKKKIHARLFARIRSGMLAEAKELHHSGLSYKRMEELGLEYRYISRLMQHKITKEEFKLQLEREIIRYAKRQMRWFKRNKDIKWVSSNAQALRMAKNFILDTR